MGKLEQDETGRWRYKPAWYERDKMEVTFGDPEEIVRFGERVLSEPRMLTTEWMMAWMRAKGTRDRTFHQKRYYKVAENLYGEPRIIYTQSGERKVGGVTREYIVDRIKNVHIPSLVEKGFSMPTILAWITFCLTNVLPYSGNLDEMAKVADELNPQAVIWYIQGVYEGEPPEETPEPEPEKKRTKKGG